MNAPTGEQVLRTMLFLLFTAATVYGFACAHDAWWPRPGDLHAVLGWKSVQYHVSYPDYGFVKRGLLPTLLFPLPKGWFNAAVMGINVVVLLALSALAAEVVGRCRAKLGPRQHLGLAGFLALSPLAFMNLGYDFGRYDAFGLLLLAVSLWQLKQHRVALVAGLTVTAILVHEAYFFYGVPLLFAYDFTCVYGTRRGTGRTSIVMLFKWLRARWVLWVMPLLAGVLIVAYGRVEAGFPSGSGVPDAAQDPWGTSPWRVCTRTLTDNVHHVIRRWTHGFYDPFTLACCAILLAAVCLVCVRVYRANRLRPDALLAAPLAVLPLFAVGTDYPRWISLFGIVAVFVIVLQVLEGRIVRLHTRDIRSPLTCLLITPLGPIGYAHIFPMLGLG